MLDQVQTRVVGRDGLETQHFLSSDLEPRWNKTRRGVEGQHRRLPSPGFHVATW